MRLLLIRHGQTPSNVLGILDTAAPGPGLTELGFEQAAAIPGSLAAERLAGIYTSRLLRTQLTAAPLRAAHPALPHVTLPGIHEIEAGDLEGLSDKPSQQRYLETVWAWGSGDLDARMPGGGDGHEFYGRVDADIARVAREHDADATVALVSHGATIRVWSAGRAANISPEFPGRQLLDNTGVVILTGDPAGGWLMESFAGTPVGGADLGDSEADDVTGEPVPVKAQGIEAQRVGAQTRGAESGR